MKKLSLYMTIMLFLILTACQSITTHMINNDFISIQPETLPPDMVGIWSGSMGPSLITIKWMENGEGILCSSWGTDVMSKIKYSDRKFFYQDGLRGEPQSITDESLIIVFPYFGVKDSIMYKDDNLTKASLFCQAQFGGKK